MAFPTTNLLCWYRFYNKFDMTKPGGGNPSDGDSIEQINDFSGNGYHLTQAVAASQPKFYESGLGIHFGPYTRFDGVDDFLRNASVDASGNAVFVCAFLEPRATAAASDLETVCSTKVGGNANGWLLDVANGFAHSQYNFIDAEYYDGATLQNQDETYFNTMTVYNQWKLIINDASIVAVQFPAHTDSGNGLNIGAIIGGAFNGNFKIGELLIYNKVMSSSEREGLFDFLKQEHHFGENILNYTLSQNDDAAEDDATGTVVTSDVDLQIGYRAGSRNHIGVKFFQVNIPERATVRHAYLRFICDFTITADAPQIDIYGNDVDSASVFSAGATSDITSRARTSTSVFWDIHEAWFDGREYISPDIAAIVQEIIDRPGWAANQDMAFMLIAQSDALASTRSAYAWDNVAGSTTDPKIWIEYSVGGTNKLVCHPGRVACKVGGGLV